MKAIKKINLHEYIAEQLKKLNYISATSPEDIDVPDDINQINSSLHDILNDIEDIQASIDELNRIISFYTKTYDKYFDNLNEMKTVVNKLELLATKLNDNISSEIEDEGDKLEMEFKKQDAELNWNRRDYMRGRL